MYIGHVIFLLWELEKPWERRSQKTNVVSRTVSTDLRFPHKQPNPFPALIAALKFPFYCSKFLFSRCRREGYIPVPRLVRISVRGGFLGRIRTSRDSYSFPPGRSSFFFSIWRYCSPRMRCRNLSQSPWILDVAVTDDCNILAESRRGHCCDVACGMMMTATQEEREMKRGRGVTSRLDSPVINWIWASLEPSARHVGWRGSRQW